MNCMIDCVINAHHEECIDCISSVEKEKVDKPIKPKELAQNNHPEEGPVSAWEMGVLNKYGICMGCTVCCWSDLWHEMVCC